MSLDGFLRTKSPDERVASYKALIDGLQGSPDTKAHAVRATTQTLQDWLSGTDLQHYASAFAALSACFEVSSADALQICDSLTGALVEACGILGESKSNDAQQLASLELAQLLSSAAAYPPARQLLQKLHGLDWLTAAVNASHNTELSVIASVAACKMLMGRKETDEKLPTGLTIDNLTQVLLRGLDVTSKGEATPILAFVLEGLAICTLTPSVRLLLSHDENGQLRKLCQLLTAPDKTPAASTQLHYSLSVLLNNLSSYRPALDNKEAAKLQRLAKEAEGRGGEGVADQWVSDEVLDRTIQRLITADVMNTVSLLCRSKSTATREVTASLVNNLVRKKDRRGLLAQQGIPTVLINLIRQAKLSNPLSDPDVLLLQALAQLLITINPMLLYGPQPDSPLLAEVVRPLCLLLVNEDGTLLHQFEALMALTNLASISEALRARIIKHPGVLDKLCDLLLLNNADAVTGRMMTRRAATQLVNNVVSSEAGFTAFAGSTDDMDGPIQLPIQLPPPDVQSRLHTLLALSGVEDVETRTAAAGALAVLTLSARVCAVLFSAKLSVRTTEIMGDLIGDVKETDLVERGFVCIGNLVRRLQLEWQAVVRQSDWESKLSSLAAQNTATSAGAKALLEDLRASLAKASV